MSIGDVIEKAFKYPWKNKALWFYGVLLAIFSAGSNLTSQYEYKESDFDFIKNVDPATLWTVIAVLGVIGVVLSVVGIIIASWSEVAIIKGTALLEKDKKITRQAIGKTGKRPVWKLIVLNVFVPIVITIAVILLLVPLVALFYFMPQPLGLYLGITVALVLILFAVIPLAVYWSMVWILAARSIALSDTGAKGALKEARKVIKGNFWWTLLLSIVMGIITGTAGLVSITPLALLGAAVYFLVIAKVYVGAIIAGVFFLLYLPVYVAVIGYFVSFQNTGWTVWWLKLKKKQA